MAKQKYFLLQNRLKLYVNKIFTALKNSSEKIFRLQNKNITKYFWGRSYADKLEFYTCVNKKNKSLRNMILQNRDKKNEKHVYS